MEKKQEQEKYLSDVLEADQFFKGTLNVVVSPCGSGKSEAAINVVTSTASTPYKALYLIVTTSGCQRIANDKKKRLKRPCHYYSEDIVNDNFDTEFDKSKIVVTTYAKFA